MFLCSSSVRRLLLLAAHFAQLVLANDQNPVDKTTLALNNVVDNLLQRPSSDHPDAFRGSTARRRRDLEAQSHSSPLTPQAPDKSATDLGRRANTFSSALSAGPDLAYILKHSNTVGGEVDSPNSAGIGIWSASNQGLYGVASQDLGYFVNINFGTPATNFKVQLDTASADTWVASTSCTDCGVNFGRRSAIGTDTSQSMVANGTTWEASYSPAYPVDGLDITLASAQGTMAHDILIFGGGLSMEHFPFGLATSVSDTFSASEIPFLGVLGLANSHAYPALSIQNQEPPIMTLYKAGKLPRPEIGIALGRSADDSNTGQLAFGGVVPSRYSGDMAIMTSVSREGYWEVPLDLTLKNTPVKSRTGIIDTRSAVIWAPQADVVALFTGVEGAFLSDSSGLVIPCSTSVTMKLQMGDYSTTLNPKDLVFTPQESSTLCGASQCCLSTIQPAPASVGLSDGQWILGIPALRGTYIGFNYEDNTIGLAAQA